MAADFLFAVLAVPDSFLHGGKVQFHDFSGLFSIIQFNNVAYHLALIIRQWL
jgi:hypothetical protein